MAYDEDLANRIREALAGEDGVIEKKMFGGLAFLIAGNMAVSASGQGGLLLRCDPAETDALVAEPHAARFEMARDGRLAARRAEACDQPIERWVAVGAAYARALPG